MFGSLLVINYFANYLLDYIFNAFYATRKIIQMFSVFSVFTQTPQDNFIVNFYKKVLLGYFSEDVKMWPSHNVLNWSTNNWLLYNIYVDSMGLYTNVNSLIF